MSVRSWVFHTLVLKGAVADPHAGARGHCAGAAGRWRGLRRKLVLDEGEGRHSSSWTRSRPPVAGRWWTPTGSRRHASVTRVGVDLTERACRPLIRLSTRRTAAAKAVRVSDPRPSTSSFCVILGCDVISVPTPDHPRARHRACAQCRVGGAPGDEREAQLGLHTQPAADEQPRQYV
ncbi:hypothetical protein EVAR_90133_1 [Eumeta japonica]|uniref:Secreted protein n=1 Tax=Eumeta variegata TaxID=151549 RepID=A0A4C2A3T2_EUMVA|nr:hypothetical protein EVAR_90133_1 [Eumeta japonica]